MSINYHINTFSLVIYFLIYSYQLSWVSRISHLCALSIQLPHPPHTYIFLSPYMTIFANHQMKDFSYLIFHPPAIAWPTDRKISWLQHWALKQLLNLNWAFLLVCHYYKAFSGLELLHISSILWALETNWKAKIHRAFSEHFGSQSYGRLFPLWPFIFCYAWPLSPPVTLKTKTTHSLLFMEIHGYREGIPFPPNSSLFISFGKDHAILCLGSNPLNCCFATEFTGR